MVVEYVESQFAGLRMNKTSLLRQQSWEREHRIAIVTPIYKKGWKEDPGNHRPVSLTSVPGKIMERFILSALTGHVKDNPGDRAQPAWVCERQVLLDQPDLLLWPGDPPSG